MISKLIRRAREFAEDAGIGAGPVTTQNWLSALRRAFKANANPTTLPAPWGEVTAISPGTVYPQVQDIFIDGNYDCAFRTPPKRIVDCGGNIGLSAIRFAQLYPEAAIEVYEANAELSNIIRENCRRAGVGERVTVEALAVSDRTGTVFFASEGDDRGRIAEGGVEVRAVDIAEVCARPIDLLKMDIEGAEFACFRRLAEAGRLGVPRAIVAELHVDPSDVSGLEQTIELLSKAGHCVAIWGALGPWMGPAACASPFRIVGQNRMFLNLYAWQRQHFL